MTVAELIEKLREMPQDAPVWAQQYDSMEAWYGPARAPRLSKMRPYQSGEWAYEDRDCPPDVNLSAPAFNAVLIDTE